MPGIYQSHSTTKPTDLPPPRFVTGIEFRESALLLSPKCQLPLRRGMVLNVNLGLSGLTNPLAEDSAGKNYSLFIGDTVLVAEVGRDTHTITNTITNTHTQEGPAVELTGMSKKKISSIAIFLGVSSPLTPPCLHSIPPERG